MSTADSSHQSLLPSGPLEAGVEIGDFRIERRLGAGGMGIVYQAHQLSLRRRVALKVLGQALTRPTDIARFQREAQAAARLRHPAIAQVYYIGQDRHLCYMAMELIEGLSLRRVLDYLGTTNSAKSSLDSAVIDEMTSETDAKCVRFDEPTVAHESSNAGESNGDKQLPPSPDSGSGANPYLSPQARELRMTFSYVRRVSEVIRDAALALVHAHEQGVVHRDIKPDNLLLDRNGKVHLIDFGVARFFDDQGVTMTGQLVGTPLYMSPEQVTGHATVDARSDNYSLGLVLYELLTLSPPIEASNRESLLRTIVTKPLIPVSWRNESIPESLQRVVHKATQKDPDQRYKTAAEFAADLDRFLAGQQVEAPAYHFRLDEREVIAARPTHVVVAAMMFFAISFCVFMVIECVSVMLGMMLLSVNGLFVSTVQSLIGIAILVGGTLIGRGLLAARIWARWIGVTAAGLLVISSLFGGITFGVTAMNFVSQYSSQSASSTVTPAVQTFPNQSTADSSKDLTDNESTSDDKPTAVSPTKAVQVEPLGQNLFLGVIAMYALPILIAGIMGVAILCALLSKKTAAWFRFAQALRTEHANARRAMRV